MRMLEFEFSVMRKNKCTAILGDANPCGKLYTAINSNSRA